MRRLKLLAIAIGLLCTSLHARSEDPGARFADEVERRLAVPEAVQRDYALRLQQALEAAGLRDLAPQYALLVDRAANIQAAFLYQGSTRTGWELVGASPVSTGRPGSFDHFLTPLGVFAHSLENRDFRAEGTRNALGVRGYGAKGMRVFDFGWALGERGWGKGGRSLLRLQLHATDPDLLEWRLGRRESKGCIRVHATLNRFLDRYGVLDAEYDEALARGEHLWMLRADRDPVRSPGKYLVVIDSGSSVRPAWSPAPRQPERRPRAQLRDAVAQVC